MPKYGQDFFYMVFWTISGYQILLVLKRYLFSRVILKGEKKDGVQNLFCGVDQENIILSQNHQHP